MNGGQHPFFSFVKRVLDGDFILFHGPPGVKTAIPISIWPRQNEKTVVYIFDRTNGAGDRAPFELFNYCTAVQKTTSRLKFQAMSPQDGTAALNGQA